MNREIKFRAWDKKAELLLPVKMMNWAEWWVSSDPTFGQSDALDYGERNSFRNKETDRHILMQYTGLKDKHGKDIYEGDIVKGFYEEYDTYFDVVNKHEFISDVKWVESCFAVHRNTASTEGRIRDYGYQSEWNSETVEVIGNIFENPELLEQSNDN
ncbi:YopX family protein [Virgibacillus oceani]